MAKAKVLLKDEFFNINTVSLLSNTLKRAYQPLKEEQFINDIVSVFPMLELKERIHRITEMLYKYLPDSYEESVLILSNSLKEIDFEGMFAFAAYPDFISSYGCKEEYIDLSLDMLGEFTKIFSAEFAIRFFINEFPVKTYDKMLVWSKSDNVHERRLASEGLRPKLPWAKGITFDVRDGAMPLDNLFYDKERYVTRSVANHLNDISKIDPMLVISTLTKWKKSKKQDEKEMDYIISHSLRTLVKKGHKETLEFLGYNYNANISISDLSIDNPRIDLGESINFSFKIKAKKDELLVIDYVVDYPMANSKRSKKVFKIKKVFLKESNEIQISKKHTFKLMTTKKLYSGEYNLVVQVNGKEFGFQKFYLTV